MTRSAEDSVKQPPAVSGVVILHLGRHLLLFVIVLQPVTKVVDTAYSEVGAEGLWFVINCITQ